MVKKIEEESAADIIRTGLFCVVGIYACYCTFGYIQEEIYMVGDRESGDMFVYSIFLVFATCFTNTLLALVWSMYKHNMNSYKAIEHLSMDTYKSILLTSITCVMSMLCTNYALTHVNYPTQILVKSAKMVPIIVGGFMLFGRRYPLYDYVAVIVITGALIMFNFSKKKSVHETEETFLGLLFLVISLVCDGFTGPRQDEIIKTTPHLSSNVLMGFTNFFCACFAGICCLVFERSAPFFFCLRHPSIVPLVTCFCLTAALGQTFIFKTLERFGSLYLALITTTRKFVSVIFSVFWFKHTLNRVQWAAVVIVFGMLTTQSVCAHYNKKKMKMKMHGDAASLERLRQ